MILKSLFQKTSRRLKEIIIGIIIAVLIGCITDVKKVFEELTL